MSLQETYIKQEELYKYMYIVSNKPGMHQPRLALSLAKRKARLVHTGVRVSKAIEKKIIFPFLIIRVTGGYWQFQL